MEYRLHGMCWEVVLADSFDWYFGVWGVVVTGCCEGGRSSLEIPLVCVHFRGGTPSELA